MAERGWREKRDYNHLSPDEFSLFRRMIRDLEVCRSNRCSDGNLYEVSGCYLQERCEIIIHLNK